MNERFIKQMSFIYEIDKVKSIFRKTRLFDNSRYENDAEHSWHLAMMALVLKEHAGTSVDILRVIKMVLMHDLVEIDGGDFIVYDKTAAAKKEEREKECAERVYGLLPADMKDEFIALWQEFEERKTPEAKFAAALDRAEPTIQNYYTEGHSWQTHDISYEQVVGVNKQKILEGCPPLWDYVDSFLKIVKTRFDKAIFYVIHFIPIIKRGG
jgi:putative hydrolase of HD superfamily